MKKHPKERKHLPTHDLGGFSWYSTPWNLLFRPYRDPFSNRTDPVRTRTRTWHLHVSVSNTITGSVRFENGSPGEREWMSFSTTRVQGGAGRGVVFSSLSTSGKALVSGAKGVPQNSSDPKSPKNPKSWDWSSGARTRQVNGALLIDCSCSGSVSPVP